MLARITEARGVPLSELQDALRQKIEIQVHHATGCTYRIG